MSRLVKKSWE